MTAFAARRPRTGARRTLVAAIAAIPDYLRMLWGLFFDRRVAWFDKMLVVAALAYAISPIDLVPDFIPVIGQADDVFFLMLAVRHLVANAGERVVLDHWRRDPEELSDEHLTVALSAAAFFLPRQIRRRLAGRVGRRR
ncbi:MAG TPA: YkvA family protein [Gemmatimonadaceae bacterium]|nr:YkvA family protein [Gemmatimonadaceae bacterium]